MGNEQNLKPLVWLVVASLVLSLVFGFLAITKTVEVPKVPAPVITDQDKADIVTATAELVINNLPAQEPATSNGTPVQEELDNDKLDTLLEELTVLSEKAKAEELALAEIETKDFKRELKAFLNNLDQGMDIESYKDISSIEVDEDETEIKVRRRQDNATVEFEIKATYFLDGDDDEDDLEKAKVLVTMKILDLDSDDDFEDSEFDEDFGYELTLVYYTVNHDKYYN